MDDLKTSLSLSQQARYQQVFDVMPTGVLLLDATGRIHDANPEAHRLLDEPLIGERWIDIIKRAFAPQDDDGHEVSLHNGRKVKLAISASSEGQLIFITDMTETRLLQSRLSELQRLSSLGKMVASLAHQVRTPLSSAMLYASHLGSEQLAPATRQRFQGKLVDRLHDLEKQVSDMLLFAKGGDNKVVTRFSLESLLNCLEAMIEQPVIHHQIDFSIDCDDESCCLLGNENALASAISNLVINAIQNAGDGAQIAIQCQLQQGNVLISVADNGPGIPVELQHKILEPFYTTRSQGTGLGLAVVQMVVHAHNGQLNVVSEPEQGACFTLQLPLADTDTE